jgi:glucose-1-phosphate cytidylyltransferase
MKAVILAGGFGTRISEESMIRPKPMIEVGNHPILWHIMKIYSHHGIQEFVLCLGYKGEYIKQYFANYVLNHSDMSIDLQNNEICYVGRSIEPWKIHLVDTGASTMTGGRLLRIREHVGDESFCMTYGDGVGDIDITASIRHHREHNAWCTLTAVQPPGRFGAFSLATGQSCISRFHEKPNGDGAWINGGFFVLEPSIFDFIHDDQTIWERDSLSRLAAQGRLSAYKHYGYWQNMDTLHDKMVLQQKWEDGDPKWAVWK